MAETQKFTIDKNNFLVYQTINDLGECVGETQLHSTDFKDPIPLKEPDIAKYYYMKLNWNDGFDDYLALDGRDWGLHEVNKTYGEHKFPSVLPKTMEYKPSYVKLNTGYTCAIFTLESDRNLYVNTFDGSHDSYQKFRYNFALSENYQYSHVVKNCDYDNPDICRDTEQFNTADDFDSSEYVGVNEYKIVNQPMRDPDSGYIYHTLKFYDLYENIDIYYKDEKAKSLTYQPIGNNISFVTFIPRKNPESYYGTADRKLEWVLCIFCRGEGTSENWDEVSRQNNPRRIKMEWRPLRFKDNNDIVVYTDEQYKDFLNRYDFEGLPEEYIPDDEERVPAKYSDTRIVELKTYNIDYNRDTTEINYKGLMYDNRNIDRNGEFKDQFYTPYSDKDVYFIKRERYYNLVMKKDGPVRGVTHNSFILMDEENNCLYCLELLKQYGIAFVRSDWVYRDETGALYVNVSQKELTSTYDWWGENTTYPMGDVVNGKIFNTRMLKLNEDNQKLIEQNGYTNTTEKCTEKLMYDYYNDYWTSPTNIEDASGLSYANWKLMVEHRTGKVEKPTLCCYGKTEAESSWSDVLYPKLNIVTENDETYYEIVIWKKPTLDFYDENQETIYSHFERYRIEAIDEYTDLGSSYKEVVFWDGNDENNLYLFTINGYNYERQNDWNETYNIDFENIAPVLENNNPIHREIVYYITYTVNLDTYYSDPIPFLPSHWTGYLNFRKGSFQKNKVYIAKAIRNTEITQEKYLEEQIQNRMLMTPAEWYGQNNKVIDDDENESQEWFWLNTVSNWCRYEVNEVDKTSVTLKVWDGLGNWDSLVDIMGYYNSGDNYILIKNYLYTIQFFRLGPGYPHNYMYWVPAYVPIHGMEGLQENTTPMMPNDGQMRYSTLILLKDSKSVLYKTKTNMDYANVYYNQEYNPYAREYYPDQSTEQSNIKPLDKDEKRKYVVGSETQPIPCVVRLNNGNLGILFEFVVQTNFSKIDAIMKNIVNTATYENKIYKEDATELNRKCKTLFGDGSDKTIEKDWKRYLVTDNTEEINSDIKYMSEETLYGSPSLTHIAAGKFMDNIEITAPRPNPTTNNKNIEDYIERWNR